MKLFKNIILILSLCAALTVLASCKNGDNTPDNNQQGTGNGSQDGQVIYSPYTETVLVLGDGVTESEVFKIKNAYYKATGKAITVKADASAASAHEIIIGENYRELSAEAYSKLGSLEKGSGEVGYIILTDGKSVAIAYDKAFGEDTALYEAVDVFVTKYMQNESLKFIDAAVIESASFEPFEKQSAQDKKTEESLWDIKLSALAGKLETRERAEAVIEELKELRALFGGGTAEWLAGLYDTELGGFYYSNSAKDADGYLPDLESTYHALSLIEYMLTDADMTVAEWLGDGFAEKTVSFVKGMQDKDNGYFYHPQWQKADIDAQKDRRERDLFDAVNILKMFGEKPIYDTPSGVKGTGEVKSTAKLTGPLNTDVRFAVSLASEVTSGEYYIPPYLKSATDFSTYLTSLDIKDDTVEACKKILSEIPLYKSVEALAEARGEKLFIIDTLLNTLSRNQGSNGLWSKNDDPYISFSTLTEIAKIYNALEKPMPKAGYIFDTAVKCLEFKNSFNDITVISNTWLALSAVIDNLLTYTTDKSEIDTLLWRIPELYSMLSEILPRTTEKLSDFVRSDGGFSRTSDNTSSNSGGMPVSVPGTREGDMSGAYYAIKVTWLSVFNVFDMGSVPLFTATDRMLFQREFSRGK